MSEEPRGEAASEAPPTNGRMVSQAGFMSAPLSFAVLTGVSGFGAAYFFLAGSGGISALLLAFVVKETLGKR